MSTRDRSIVVLGGTGAIGSAVLRQLAQRELTADFTYFTSGSKARYLTEEHRHRGWQVDLGDAAATRQWLQSLTRVPNVLIHCAAVTGSEIATGITDQAWDRMLAVNTRSAFVVANHMAAHATERTDIVLTGAMERTQSLPLPLHFAASQGALAAMVMALAHELGPRDVFVNMMTFGVIDGGLSQGLDAQSRQDYERFSALRRIGTADEAATALLWLALENTYIQGKVIPVNGGI